MIELEARVVALELDANAPEEAQLYKVTFEVPDPLNEVPIANRFVWHTAMPPKLGQRFSLLLTEIEPDDAPQEPIDDDIPF